MTRRHKGFPKVVADTNLSSTMLLYFIWATVTALAAPQYDTLLPFGSLDRSNNLQVRAPFDLRSVLEGGTAGHLEARQSCPGGRILCGSNNCMPSTSTCCSNGLSCRAGTDCMEDGCCPSGTVSCDATDGSGTEGCYPASQGATCCSNGEYCDPGYYCTTGGCCPDGRVCTGGGTGGGVPAPPVGGQPSTSTRTAASSTVTSTTPFTPNPNPRKCGLGGASTKSVDLYWEVTYIGVWYEYQRGQCDKAQKPKNAKGIGNTFSIEFEDDVRGFSLSVSLADYGNLRVRSGGVEQNITILNTETVSRVAQLEICPVSYKYVFPAGSSRNTLSLEYVHSDVGFRDFFDGDFFVHQVM